MCLPLLLLLLLCLLRLQPTVSSSSTSTSAATSTSGSRRASETDGHEQTNRREFEVSSVSSDVTAAIAAAIAPLQEQLATQQSLISNLTARIDSDAIINYRIIATLNAQIALLQSQQQTGAKAASAASTTLASLVSRVDQVQANLTDATTAIIDQGLLLQLQSNTLTALSDLTGSSAIVSIIRQTNSSVAALQTLVTQHTNSIADLSKLFDSQQTTLQSLIAANVTQGASLAQLSQQTQALSSSLSSLTTTVASDGTALTTLQSRATTDEASIAALGFKSHSANISTINMACIGNGADTAPMTYDLFLYFFVCGRRYCQSIASETNFGIIVEVADLVSPPYASTPSIVAQIICAI